MRVNGMFVVALVVVPIALRAQDERVIVHLAPAPSQALQMRMLEEINLELEPAEGASARPIGPVKVALTITLVSSMTVGAADDQGRVDVRVTYDDARMDGTMNEQPAPFPDMLGALVGRQFTMTYDRDGRIVDMRAETPSSVFDAAKPLLRAAFGAGGSLALAVGETVTRPIDVPLPIPGAGSGGGFKSEMRYTLRSISQDGGSRVAHLATAVAGDLQPTSDAAPAAMGFHLAGEGAIDVDLDRGVIKTGEQRLTIDGAFGAAGASGGVPQMRMHGTMKMSQTTQ